MKTLCGWAVGLAHVPQSGLPDLIRPARTDTPSAPCASTPTDARTAGPAPAPPWLRPPAPESAAACRRRRVPGPSRAVCTLETGRYRPGRTASRHGTSEPRSSPARARGRPRRPASSPRVPRSRTGPSVWPGREPRRTDGRCPATAAPWTAAASRCQGPCALMRCRVVRGGGVMRCAGRRCPAVWGRWRAGTACACCAR